MSSSRGIESAWWALRVGLGPIALTEARKTAGAAGIFRAEATGARRRDTAA